MYINKKIEQNVGIPTTNFQTTSGSQRCTSNNKTRSPIMSFVKTKDLKLFPHIISSDLNLAFEGVCGGNNESGKND